MSTAARTDAFPGWDSSLAGRFFGALFAAYYEESVRYAVLRNYERWPEHFGKDVDLVVDPNDLALSHGIIRRLAADFGLSFTVRRKRSSHVTYYLVGTLGEDALILDLRPDVVHHGLVYLPGTLVLASRRRHADGFYVPSPALESLAILLHAVIDAGTVRPSYQERLAELGTGDPAEFLAAADAAVGPELAARLADCIESRAFERATALRGRLVRAASFRRPATLLRWLGSRIGAAADRVCGWVRPSGHLVILVGPDGSGKTTSAELLCQRFAATRIPVSAVYLGAQAPLLPTRRLSQQLRKRLSTGPKVKVVKDVTRRQRLRGLVHIMADKWLRYIVYVRPRLARGEVVVLDRYFYDLRTFPHPLDEPVDRQLIGANAVQRSDPTEQHVIQPAIDARLFQSHQIPWLLDYAQLRPITSLVAANRTQFALGQVVTGAAIMDVFSDVADRVGQAKGLGLVDP